MSRIYSLVALLDVLAYRTLLNADRESGRADFKQKLESALGVFASINETELSYQAISDSVIIAGPPSTSLAVFLSTVAKVQQEFLNAGLLVRGGIAFEQHFKSGNVTYSHALAVAYGLERNKAIYPRVVVDSSVVDMLENGGKFSPEDVRAVFDGKLLSRQDGIYFVNFASDRAGPCFAKAKQIYEEQRVMLDGDEHKLAKHRWLQNYLRAMHPDAPPAYIGEIETLTDFPSSATPNV